MIAPPSPAGEEEEEKEKEKEGENRVLQRALPAAITGSKAAPHRGRIACLGGGARG